MNGAAVQPYRTIRYVPEFDGLRGFALLVVVISHTAILYPLGRWSTIPGGFLGLDMFFVLSGFLITALLLREQLETQSVNLGAFYIRRVLRLLPGLFIMLGFQWCYATFAGYPKQVEHSTLLSVCFYYFNWQVASGHPVIGDLGHLWSLSVEEQFYLIWPLGIVTVLHLRRSIRPVALMLIVLIGAVALHRAMLFRHEMQWHKVYTRTDTRGDAILVGALVAQLWVRCHSPKKFIATAASAASVFLLWGLICLRPERPSLYMGVLTLIALAWGIIIIAILETDWWISPLLRFRPLRLLGRVSYGAYLWHLPIFVIVKREGAGLPAFVKVAIALLATAVATQLSWLLVERRCLAIKSTARPSAFRHALRQA